MGLLREQFACSQKPVQILIGGLLLGSLLTLPIQGWALFGDSDEDPVSSEKHEEKNCQFIPATPVCLIQPEGFSQATTFNGYQNKEKNAWVMVSEIQGGYASVSKGMTTELLEKEGLHVLDRREVYLNNQKKEGEAIPAQLLSIRQRVKSTGYFKWLLLFGDDDKTIMVNAFYPMQEKVSNPLGQELESILMAAQWDPQRKLDIEANLSFKIKPEKGLKLAQRMQNTLLYTRDGKTPNPSPEDPMFIVGRSFFEQQIKDPLAFAKNRVIHFPTLKDVEIESVEPAKVDKLEGFEIMARAKDKQTASPMTLYQMMLFSGQHYYILVGAVGKNDTENYFEQFKKTAQSFKRE